MEKHGRPHPPQESQDVSGAFLRELSGENGDRLQKGAEYVLDASPTTRFGLLAELRELFGEEAVGHERLNAVRAELREKIQKELLDDPRKFYENALWTEAEDMLVAYLKLGGEPFWPADLQETIVGYYTKSNLRNAIADEEYRSSWQPPSQYEVDVALEADTFYALTGEYGLNKEEMQKMLAGLEFHAKDMLARLDPGTQWSQDLVYWERTPKGSGTDAEQKFRKETALMTSTLATYKRAHERHAEK